MAEVIFGIESYESYSLPLSAQRLVNCFFEKQPRGAKGQTPLFGAPGLTTFCALPTSPVRGLWNWSGSLYAVGGDTLYRVNSNGGYRALGAGISGNSVVTMSNNATQLMVINDVSGYLVDQDNNYQQIRSPNFFSAQSLVFLDNYFLLNRRGTNEFFYSALSDGTSYSGLDFASAEAKPGLLLSVAENLQLIFLFCQNHIETWYDAGLADNPFQRYAGGVIEYGCQAAKSVVNQDDALFFLGSDKVFYRLQGNVPIRVSTHAVENAIRTYGDVSDAFCFTYTFSGHKMVHLTFPTAMHSWVYDISTQKWHERDSLDSNGNSLGRWIGNCAAEVYSRVMIGDAYSGNIYFLDWENYTENGNTMRFLAHSAPVQADKLRVYINRVELDMETGVAPATGQGSAPQILLRWSKDGGKTWSRLQPYRSMGALGEYLARLRWISLGQAYQWVFELVITDAIKRVLIATHLDAEEGMP